MVLGNGSIDCNLHSLGKRGQVCLFLDFTCRLFWDVRHSGLIKLGRGKVSSFRDFSNSDEGNVSSFRRGTYNNTKYNELLLLGEHIRAM